MLILNLNQNTNKSRVEKSIFIYAVTTIAGLQRLNSAIYHIYNLVTHFILKVHINYSNNIIIKDSSNIFFYSKENAGDRCHINYCKSVHAILSLKSDFKSN